MLCCGDAREGIAARTGNWGKGGRGAGEGAGEGEPDQGRGLLEGPDWLYHWLGPGRCGWVGCAALWGDAWTTPAVHVMTMYANMTFVYSQQNVCAYAYKELVHPETKRSSVKHFCCARNALHNMSAAKVQTTAAALVMTSLRWLMLKPVPACC